MEIVKKYGNSIWRIPLISILSGLCYDPVYIKILMRFGTVSYTHLDVYKRQVQEFVLAR